MKRNHKLNLESLEKVPQQHAAWGPLQSGTRQEEPQAYSERPQEETDGTLPQRGLLLELLPEVEESPQPQVGSPMQLVKHPLPTNGRRLPAIKPQLPQAPGSNQEPRVSTKNRIKWPSPHHLTYLSKSSIFIPLVGKKISTREIDRWLNKNWTRSCPALATR
jgi:hypothetical protein